MPKYLIEREIPGAGALTPEQLQGISQKSLWCVEWYGAKDPMAGKLRDRQ